MALNPQYQPIAQTFVQQYYQFLDDPAQRVNMANFYNEEKSLMTFEGQQLFGRAKIMEKVQGLQFQKIAHSITMVDSHPMFNGGILVSVLGQLKNFLELYYTLSILFCVSQTDDDPAHAFNQTFILKPIADSFYVEHDIFRLNLHHAA
ncbi:NUTF2 [Cordylochernes scorpioides]|uniref:NTF2-related export protein n=1 Tax=Cordylochernes scorpioides TaxID=51811 RepID=A0ABY6LUQ7_9ARAC|nr:NUTF2 [Cordylochernes scorpioides]